MTVPIVFAVAALIIMAGFAGRVLFQKTHIPDIPILLGIGVMLGPVFHLVDSSLLLPLAPYLGTLALLMILLEGGMKLDAVRVFSQMKRAILLTHLAFLFTTVFIAVAYRFLTGAPFPQSFLLGALLGCTSGAIVIPLVRAMRMAENTRTILTLEAAIGDALAVVLVFVLIRYIRSPSPDLGRYLLATANAFLWGAVLGGLAGIFWVWVLGGTGRLPLSYMLTLGAMLLLYSGVEGIHSSGVIAVLVFGMVLSNGDLVMKWIRSSRGTRNWETSRFALDDTIHWFHEELSFVARVFFFVYLGMLMDFRRISPEFLEICALLVLLVYLARHVSVRVVGRMGRRQPPFERKILVSMAPRGLASAVLATVPVASGVPGTADFLQYAFGVIAVTNLFLTASVLRSERRLDAILAETARAAGKDDLAK